MEKPISINGLILIQETLLEYFQQPQFRLKHTLALAGCSPLVFIIVTRSFGGSFDDDGVIALHRGVNGVAGTKENFGGYYVEFIVIEVRCRILEADGIDLLS
eukprot:scaffold49940_cov25-Cyclotella_meneghiniana.AAC.1